MNYLSEAITEPIDSHAGVLAQDPRETMKDLTLKLCAGEVGANAGESPVGRIGLFTTENCVGEWGREASSASTARIEQAGRNENEPHSMSLERFTTVEAAERLTSPRRPMGERKGRRDGRASITVEPFSTLRRGQRGRHVWKWHQGKLGGLQS
jgi:hypothetical protein